MMLIFVAMNYKFTTSASWNPHRKWLSQFLGFTVLSIIPSFLDKDKKFFISWLRFRGKSHKISNTHRYKQCQTCITCSVSHFHYCSKFFTVHVISYIQSADVQWQCAIWYSNTSTTNAQFLNACEFILICFL